MIVRVDVKDANGNITNSTVRQSQEAAEAWVQAVGFDPAMVTYTDITALVEAQAYTQKCSLAQSFGANVLALLAGLQEAAGETLTAVKARLSDPAYQAFERAAWAGEFDAATDLLAAVDSGIVSADMSAKVAAQITAYSAQLAPYVANYVANYQG